MPRALIFGPQRRSMVSSSPITTGAAAGRKEAVNSNRSRLAAARDDHANTVECAEPGIALAAQDTQCRRNGATGRKNDTGEQHQNVRPGWPREQVRKLGEAGEKARWKGIGAGGRAMGVVHPTRRTEGLNRATTAAPRQIQSAVCSALRHLA